MALKIPVRAESTAATTSPTADKRQPVIHRPSVAGSGKTTFAEAKVATNHRMIISLSGEEKTGKNFCSFTAPEPIYVHSFDVGLEGVVDKFIDGTFGKKRIYVADYELTIQPDEATPQEVADAASKVFEQFITNYRDGLASCGQGTTVIDTDTELWSLCRLARLGKLTQVMPHHYAPVNAEFRDVVREAYNHNGNLFLLGMMGDEWENDAGGKGKKTGRKVRKGFNDLGFLVQIVAETTRTDLVGGGSEFGVTITDCRFNPSVNGTTVPNDYDLIHMAVFGE